jgi:ribosomal-protein-alanine N-acetyltransferase
MNEVKLETERLILRQWKREDFLVFQQLNSDPIVMEYFPSVLSKVESNVLAQKIYDLIESKGWGLWAVEEKKSGDFIGCVGLYEPSLDLPFSPCVEISWRLLKKYWGKGYATEAAKKALVYAFEELNLDEVVSFTAHINHRSEAVMQRLSMKKLDKTFEHPALPMSHRLRKHLLYTISKEEFLKRSQSR